MFNRLITLLITIGLIVYCASASRVRRQIPGTACPDSNTGVCRNCACSPTTARTTRAGLPVVSSVFGQPFDSQCDRCCFVETLVFPSCPINPATNQQRQALAISTATSLQTLGVQSSGNYVGCCPFTPCQPGYACMFDQSNALYLCCSTGSTFVPSMPPTFPTQMPTQFGDRFGCTGGTTALIYRLPSGVVPDPNSPVVGCLDNRGRCPTGTTCQPGNNMNPTWFRGICCVPVGVDQRTIPILIN